MKKKNKKLGAGEPLATERQTVPPAKIFEEEKVPDKKVKTPLIKKLGP